MKIFTKENLQGKKVFLRVDFNVTVAKGKVEEEYKINAVMPTVEYLIKMGAQILLFSHFGRPNGKKNKKFSLQPVFGVFKKKCSGVKIRFVKDVLVEKNLLKIAKYKEPILFFENVRFYQGEEKNDPQFAKLLAKMADVYVNEAFACSHRENASTVGIAKLLPSFAGLHLNKEIEYLSKALEPQKPSLAIVGGAKVSTKFVVLNKFSKIYDQVLLGGGLANTFFKAKGYDIGDSFCEDSEIRNAKKLLNKKNLILPIDVLVRSGKKVFVKMVVGKKICQKKEKIMDIGPATIKYYSELIKKAQNIIWGGPMGFLEEKRFSHGSLAVARVMGSIAGGKVLGIAGGGETVWAINQAKMARYFDFISTGGSAMLEFLEGRKLPGIAVLK
ncbi:MAG: phosphoglycerate kinase [Patescibacteria group bacterium]